MLAAFADLPIAPDRLAVFSPIVVVCAGALGLGAALLGALMPAIRASRTEPMTILRA